MATCCVRLRPNITVRIVVEFMAHHVPSQAGNETSEDYEHDYETYFVRLLFINSLCTDSRSLWYRQTDLFTSSVEARQQNGRGGYGYCSIFSSYSTQASKANARVKAPTVSPPNVNPEYHSGKFRGPGPGAGGPLKIRQKVVFLYTAGGTNRFYPCSGLGPFFRSLFGPPG